MDLTSPNFEEGGQIPQAHTCDGQDAPPELHWSGVPSGVVELALTCEDPDAPGGTFVHWVAWGIDPSAGRLTPDGGTEGMDSGATATGAPVRRRDTAHTGTSSRSTRWSGRSTSSRGR
jgi:Raf kinase inhibitor-like YbhB/YbcL family protein